MADDDRDITTEDILRQYGDQPVRRTAELRSHEPPWYDKPGHALTDWWYGPEANARQGAWAQKLVGRENPFNFPAQIGHGVDLGKTGYQLGSWPMMGAGAAEAGLAAIIPGAMAASAITRPIQSAVASQAAKRAAKAAEGPWGYPGGPDAKVREFLDAPERVPGVRAGAHPLNAKSMRDDMEANASPPFTVYDNANKVITGKDGAVGAAALSEERQAARWQHFLNTHKARTRYDEIVQREDPMASYGRHVSEGAAARNNPARPMSNEQLDAQEQALATEAHKFLLPKPREMLGDAVYNPMTQKWQGRMEPRAGDAGRWSHTAIESGTVPNDPKKLADVVRRHANANANIPGAEAEGNRIADALEGLGAKQWPHRQANYKDYFGFDDLIGDKFNRDMFAQFDKANPGMEGVKRIGHWRRHGDRYLDDVDHYFKGNPLNRDVGISMEPQDLHRVLKTDFGADPKNPESVKKAYDAFWKEEQRRLHAGQPTIHEQEAAIQKKMQDNATRQRFGLDPDNPKNKQAIRDAWDKELSQMMGEGDEARKGAERRMRGMPDLEKNPTMQAIADKVLRYGPPTAVGGAAGHQLGGMYRDFAHDNWENRGGRERSLRLPYPPDPNKP